MAGWELGAPTSVEVGVNLVEVTDGTLVALARLGPAKMPTGSVIRPWWLDESGSPLDWQPTHWRAKEQIKSPDVVSID